MSCYRDFILSQNTKLLLSFHPDHMAAYKFARVILFHNSMTRIYLRDTLQDHFNVTNMNLNQCMLKVKNAALNITQHI